MAKKETKRTKSKPSGSSGDGKTPKTYEHTEEKLLLRPDVGLQPQFKAKKAQKDGREVGMLILEAKGYDPLKHIKIGAAHRWVHAVNEEGSHGRWAYRIVSSPAIVPAALASAAAELANPPRTDWRAALKDFTVAMRELYGHRLDRVILYGSRARGDAEWDSDVDILVVLDRSDNFWKEMDRISAVAGDIMVKHGVVLNPMPAGVRELETSDKPIFRSIRRDGVPV